MKKNLVYIFTILLFLSCEDDNQSIIFGCTNDLAVNYNSTATEDDGSCILSGCTDESASNYDSTAIEDDGSCFHYNVFAGNFYYDPQNLTINVGQTVRWINDGGFHDVNGEINSLNNEPFDNPEVFNSDAISEVGAVIFTYTFQTPGVYNYDCSVGGHALNGMIGIITVNAIE